MKKGYIYKITNLLNGKIYIGKSTRCDDYHLEMYFGSGLAIHAAIEKYGRTNFKKEILQFLMFNDEKRLDVLERWYISCNDAMNPAKGYNLSLGGEGGTTSEISLKGAATRRKHGKLHLKEITKERISAALKNRKKSELHKQHLSEHHRLRCAKTIIFEDGHCEISYQSLEEIANRFGLSGIKLKRYSEYDKFRNGVKIKEYVNQKLVKQHEMIENGIFKDPINGDEITYNQLRARKSFNKESYRNVDLFSCFLKFN